MLWEDVQSEIAYPRYVTLASHFHMTLTLNYDLQLVKLRPHAKHRAGQSNIINAIGAYVTEFICMIHNTVNFHECNMTFNDLDCF